MINTPLSRDQGAEIGGSNPWISAIPGASHNLSARAPTTDQAEDSSKVDEGKVADALLPYFTQVVCEAWCSSYPRSKPSRENIEAISRAGFDLCDPQIINLWFNKRLGMSTDEDSGYFSSSLNLPSYPKNDVKRRSTPLIEMTAGQSSRSTSSRYFCCFCKKRFTLKRVLRRHENNAHGPPQHPCHKCGKKYKRRYLLIEHLKSHDDTNEVDEAQPNDDNDSVASEAGSHCQNLHDEDREGGGASGSSSGHMPSAFSSSNGGHTSSNASNFSSSSAPPPSNLTTLCFSYRSNSGWLPASWDKDCTPKFEVLRFLGAGAWAAVREIKFHEASISVACKSPRSQSILHQHQILHEIRILNRLDHRNIVQSVGTLTTSSTTHLLMLPVADYNLSTYLLSSPLHHEISESRLYGWWRGITSAIEYMHRSSCAHFDLKPQNILIESDRILISDFGMSRISVSDDENKCLPPRSQPTGMYAAPSVSRGAFSHAKSDLFSLSCIFLELLFFTQIGPLTDKIGTSFSSAVGSVPSGTYSTHLNEILMWIPDLRALSSPATRLISDWCVEALQDWCVEVLQEAENLGPKPAKASENDRISAEQAYEKFSDLGFEAEQLASGTLDSSKRTTDITTRLHEEWSIQRRYSLDCWLAEEDSMMKFLVTGKSNCRQSLYVALHDEKPQKGVALLPADSQETGVLILRSEPLDFVCLPPSHMCLFDFLGCKAAFSDVSSWKSHIISHFLGRPLPPDATCPMCGSEFTEQPIKPGRAWETMLDHITQVHLKSGLFLRSANPDFALHRYLCRNGIISVKFYRRLCEGYARMGFDFGDNGLPFILDPKSRRLRPLRGPMIMNIRYCGGFSIFNQDTE